VQFEHALPPYGQTLGRKAAYLQWPTQPHPQRGRSRCLSPSPTEALIDLKVRRRVGRFIPVWGWLNALTGLRFGAIPQRRPACRGDVWWLWLHPDVLQYLPDVGAVSELHAWAVQAWAQVAGRQYGCQLQQRELQFVHLGAAVQRLH
jgi:hypothetical protein